MTNGAARTSLKDLHNQWKRESISPRRCNSDVQPKLDWKEGNNRQVCQLYSKITDKSGIVDLAHLLETNNEETEDESLSSESVIYLDMNKLFMERNHSLCSPSDFEPPLYLTESKDKEFRGTKPKSTKLPDQCELCSESTGTSDSEASHQKFFERSACLGRDSVNLQKYKRCITPSIPKSSTKTMTSFQTTTQEFSELTEDASNSFLKLNHGTSNPFPVARHKQMRNLENGTFQEETEKDEKGARGGFRFDATS